MTHAQDHARAVNAVLSPLHHLWAERSLGIPAARGRGPDLYDSSRDLGVELKFSLYHEHQKGYSWTVNRKQCRYASTCQSFFWAVGVYSMRNGIQDISDFSPASLERQVTFRELYVMPVDWITRTNLRWTLTQGHSRTRSWKSYLGYPKSGDLLPLKSEAYRVQKGMIYLASVISGDFFVNGEKEDFEAPSFLSEVALAS